MTTQKMHFRKLHQITLIIGAFCILIAPHVSSGATARRTVATARVSAGTTTTTAKTATKTTTSKNNAEKSTTPEPEPIIVENKADQFDTVLSDVDSTIDTSATNSVLDAANRRRAEIKKQEMAQAASAATKQAFARGENACDKTLRQCMQTKCGQNFEQCAGDTDTIWGTKLDACRRDTTCTGTEYGMFIAEIKADRDAFAKLGLYNKIVDCGNRFNDCVISECGTTMEKCIGKQNGDAALNKCKQISQECQEADSGLSARANNAFAQLRQVAEKQIAIDEKRLYTLRDQMRETCERMGAKFDERTLDCIYTIEFWGGEDNTLFASRRVYAGTEFNCDQNWFGVDTTTFMENAFRLTRSQTSASSAMLGSGLGVGVGAITSGAIDRAVDRAKAERALGDKLCESTGGKWNKTINTCKCPKGAKFDDESGCQTDEAAAQKAKEKEEKQAEKDKKKAEKEEEKQKKKDAKAAEKQADIDKQKNLCTGGNPVGTWDDNKNKCTCPNEGTTYYKFDKSKGCVKNDYRTKQEEDNAERREEQELNKLLKAKEKAEKKYNNAKTEEEKQAAFKEMKAADKAYHEHINKTIAVSPKITPLKINLSTPDPSKLLNNK